MTALQQAAVADLLRISPVVDQLGHRLEERKQQARTGATYAGAAIGALVAVVVLVKIVKKVRS